MAIPKFTGVIEAGKWEKQSRGINELYIVCDCTPELPDLGCVSGSID